MFCLQLVWTAKATGETYRIKEGYEVVVSYLPLSHIAAQLIDMYITLLHAGTVYFAQPDALKVGKLADT